MSKIAAAILSIGFLLAGGSALAQDSMKKDSMSQDAMGNDAVKKDKVAAMSKDCTDNAAKKGVMGKDAMKK